VVEVWAQRGRAVVNPIKAPEGGEKLRVLERIEGTVIPIAVSTIAASVAMVAVFVLVIFVGVKLFSDELTDGVPLDIGVPFAIITGAVVFVWTFRKMRSLE
jgi:hypothetical protein